MKKIVVLISGRGSNFVAIQESALREDWEHSIGAKIVAVFPIARMQKDWSLPKIMALMRFAWTIKRLKHEKRLKKNSMKLCLSTNRISLFWLVL